MEALEATAFARPPLSAARRFSAKPPCRRSLAHTRKVVIRARRETDSGDYGGRVVDENMIVLRMRIREAEISERSHLVPSDWMEWEKKYYGDYNEDVCEAVGMLQSVLMNTRPCLAFGMVVIVALSVPISTFVVVVHAIEVAKWVLSRFPISM